tara:strand:- start:889 stop:2013 length:1125 start_codon:yes stop_codon:yes gene_type:complete
MPRVMVVGGVADYGRNSFRRKLHEAGFDFDPAQDHVRPTSRSFTKDVTRYDGVILLKGVGMMGGGQADQVKALCKQNGVPCAEVQFKWSRAWPVMSRVFGGTDAMPVAEVVVEEEKDNGETPKRPWEDPALWATSDEDTLDVDPVERTRQYTRMYFEDNPENIVNLPLALDELLAILDDRTKADVQPILEETASAMQEEWYALGGRGGRASDERAAFMEIRWLWLKRHLLTHYDEHGDFPTQPPVIAAGRAIFLRPTSTTHISKARAELVVEIADRAEAAPAAEPAAEPAPTEETKTVKAVIKPDNKERFRQMRELWIACRGANVAMHPDAEAYFGAREPSDDPDGILVLETFEDIKELPVAEIPEGTTHLVVS